MISRASWTPRVGATDPWGGSVSLRTARLRGAWIRVDWIRGVWI